MMPACSSAETGVGVSITSGQPAMKRKLRRLQESRDREEQSRQSSTRRSRLGISGGVQERGDVGRAEGVRQQDRGTDQASIGHPCGDELLAGGDDRLRAIGIE